MSLDPSDRANHPLVVMPTAASANAAAPNRIEATGRCDGLAARNEAVGAGVTGGSANTGFAGEKSAGISVSEERDSASCEGADFAFRGLRGLYARARWAPVLALLGRCKAMIEATVSSAIVNRSIRLRWLGVGFVENKTSRRFDSLACAVHRTG
jgi:hypothetical protein